MVLGNDQTGGGFSPGKEFGELEKREEMVGWLGRGEGWLGTGNFQLAHYHRCHGQGGNSTGS